MGNKIIFAPRGKKDRLVASTNSYVEIERVLIPSSRLRIRSISRSHDRIGVVGVHEMLNEQHRHKRVVVLLQYNHIEAQ